MTMKARIISRDEHAAFVIEPSPGGFASFKVTLGSKSMISGETEQVSTFFTYTELKQIMEAMQNVIEAGA